MSGKLYKHNPVIRGHLTDASDLSIDEEDQRVIALGEFEIDLFNAIYYFAQQSLWHTNIDDIEYESILLRYSDIKKFMGIRSNDFKDMAISALIKLKTTDIVWKSYTYPSGKTLSNVHVSAISWFAEEVNFDPDTFQVDLNPMMSMAMAQHKGNFTLIDLQKTRRLTSKYAKRLYEWLLSMKQINKKISVDLDKINKLFGLEEKDFKQHNRILKRIYPQLEPLISFQFEYNRTDKTITFTF